MPRRLPVLCIYGGAQQLQASARSPDVSVASTCADYLCVYFIVEPRKIHLHETSP